MTEDYLTSDCSFQNYVCFQELEVVTYNNDGFPDLYNPAKSFFASSTDTNMNIEMINKIYFNKRSKDIEWFDVNTRDYTDTLPITVRKGKWYKIYGYFSRGECISALLKIDYYGKVKMDTRYEERMPRINELTIYSPMF